MKIRVKKIAEPVFTTEIYLLVGDKEHCNKWLQKKYDIADILDEKSTFASTCDIVSDTGRMTQAMWFSPLAAKRKFRISTLTHESLHATINVMEHSGILLTKNTHEPYCFLLGWIAEEVDNFL